MNLSQDGHLAAGVPGTVAGLFASHKYGKLPFDKLIQPAIDLAENGFALTKREAASIALPPCCKIDKPTLLANGCADTRISQHLKTHKR